MLSIFRIIRFSIFFTVMTWSLIVLGLAAFFDHLIIAGEMTRYVPYAIFAAVITLVTIPTLLIAGSLRRYMLLSEVRTELGLTGLLGLFWFILGITTGPAEDVTITCDFDGSGDFIETDEYSTDMYQEQLRVLRAFSIFNALLLIGYFLFLLFLAFRQHHMGRRIVWTSTAATYPWFGAPALPTKDFNVSQESLPVPVTAKGSPGKPKSPPKGTTTLTGEVTGMNAGGHYIIYIPPPPSGNR